MKIIPYFQQFLLLNLLSLLIFGLDSLGLLSLPKSSLATLTNPISEVLFKFRQTVSSQFYFISEARFAAQENKALRSQLADLFSENAELRSNLRELQTLIDQQNSLDLRTYNLTVARPIGLTRYLLIDKGSLDNIKVGQAVVFKNNLIGKIFSVSQRRANVQLISDPDFKISAFSLNQQGRAKGLIIGQFGTHLLMDKILHEEEIKPGDLVYSEGLEANLPRGLILGKVVAVNEVKNEVFKKAQVEPIFTISDLELVFIIGD